MYYPVYLANAAFHCPLNYFLLTIMIQTVSITRITDLASGRQVWGRHAHSSKASIHIHHIKPMGAQETRGYQRSIASGAKSNVLLIPSKEQNDVMCKSEFTSFRQYIDHYTIGVMNPNHTVDWEIFLCANLHEYIQFLSRFFFCIQWPP